MISIKRERDWLTFSPLDSPDRPAFQDGRFFLDAAQGIAAASNGVYTLVPQRGVVRRDLDRPNEILDFWRLPPSPQPLVSLDAAGNAIRLRAEPRDGRSTVGFTRAAGGKSWQPWEPGRETVQVAVGAVMWRGDAQAWSTYMPYMRGGQNLPLSDWWRATRFAWDDVRALGALADDIAVFSTAAGLIVLRLDGGPEALAWSLHPTFLDHVATVRRNGLSQGLAVWGASAGFLITRSRGHIDMAAVQRPKDLLEVSGLVLNRRESPEGGVIALRERWGKSGEWRPLETELRVPVFSGGQLAIDASSAAAPLTTAARTDRWTAAGCYDAGCLMVRNEIVGNELVPRDIMPARAPCRFTYLREISDGLAGICEGTGKWTAWRLTPSQKVWTRVDPASVADAFRLGGGVAFDVQTLTWRQSGDQLPWSGRPFTVEPQANPPVYLHPGANGVQFVFDPEAPRGQWAVGIARLRRDARDRLWAWMPGLQLMGRFEPPSRWEFQPGARWPAAEFARDGWTVTFGGDGLSHGET